MERILFKNIGNPGQSTLEVYKKSGGYSAWEKVLKEIKPEDLIEMVKKSGLRGRGGAGFPTGLKWSFVPKSSPEPKYLVCNADESEPGTFKDRELLEKDPHLVLEGVIISSYAVQAHTAFIYFRGEFSFPFEQMDKALEEAYQTGYLGKNILNSGYHLDVFLYRGGGAYICGEETALLESLEGNRGLARMKPPFPATSGLYASPTVVNNVETLANLPYIVLQGPEKFASLGTPKSTGTKIFSLSGHIQKPGNYELEMGTPLRYLIEECGGGIKNGKKLKTVIPGGPSVPMLSTEQLDTGLDFESLAEAGSLLGSGGVIVIDEDTCMVEVVTRLVDFFKHESCGKCTPCREGTVWLSKIVHRIESGEGKQKDLDLLLAVSDNIAGRTICALGDAAVVPVVSGLKLFRKEFEYHIENKKCQVGSKHPFN